MGRRFGPAVPPGPASSRREFLKTAVRLGLGGALGLLGFLLLGGKNRAPGAARCTADYYCRACVRSSACPLPQALSFRKKFGG